MNVTSTHADAAILSLALPLLLSVVFSFAIGIVMIVGGLKMMRLQSHGLATTASVLALLPCGPAGIIGLIVGIWSLVVLSRPDVKAAFQNRLPGQPFPPASRSTSRQRGGLGVVFAVLFAGCAGILVILMIVTYFRSKHLPPPQPPVATIVDHKSEPDPARGPSKGWTLGKNGPELTDTFARLSLKLDPAQLEKVNNILQASYQEYPALEAEHTEQHTDDVGHLVLRIKPHAGPIAKLEDRLWSQLDAILNPEQQAIARLNLRLDSPEKRPPIYVSELVRPGFFGWGKNGADIEIWRVGTWHHWKVRTRGFEESSSGPDLPEEYRRFWKEPTAPPTDATKEAKHE
jgi:hypothetical protein